MRLLAFLMFLPLAVFSQDLTLTISSQEAPSCSGESDGIIVLMASGGVSPYLYSIVGGNAQESNIFQGLSSGDYEFSVTDSDGMVATVSGTLENGPNLSISINDVNPTCMEAIDGQLMISEVNGVSNVTYEISGPVSASNMTGLFIDLPIGIYTVRASASSQCLVVISTELSSDVECEEEVEDLTLLIVNQEAPSCTEVPDGIVVLMASGGVSPYTYGIVGGVEQDSSVFQGLEAGDYQFYVNDADGNTQVISAILVNEINLSIILNNINPSCKDASDGQLVLSEGNDVSNVTYEISGPTSASNLTGIFTDLPIGTYQVSVSINAECSVVSSTVLSSNEDCPEDEDPNICPLLVNRIGMQINKVGEDEYSLRMLFKDEVDVIKYVNYTALHEIIHFHLLQRQMNVSLNPNFEFKIYCSDVESMRNETSDNTSVDNLTTTSTQSEISLIREFVLNIKNGESLKI